MNKNKDNSKVTELGANQTIYRAIREIAMHKLVNSKTNTFRNTSRTTGYVVKFHDDENDELYGTVDVQEYISGSTDIQAQQNGLNVGLHEGVYLSAIQHNDDGIVVVPFLYSDVVIATDPESLREYVVQYSHADKVQIDSHSNVSIGVTETKEYKNDKDSPDYDELEKTGNSAHTIYTPTSAIMEVVKGKGGDNEKSVLEVTADKVSAKHNKSELSIEEKLLSAKNDKAQLLLDANQLLTKYDAKEIVINSKGVFLGSGSASEPAVLGNQLADILTDLTSTLSQMMTTTMMGPQPPLNLAKFAALQAKISSFKASTSGFLSKSVKVNG